MLLELNLKNRERNHENQSICELGMRMLIRDLLCLDIFKYFFLKYSS